ncbi:MAG: hypothetical protein RR326_01155 [Stenotrophomonas sp.]
MSQLRDEMPETAAFIDALREAFGVVEINQQIRGGMHGEPVFFARENGREIGTPLPEPKFVARYASVDEMTGGSGG